MISVVTIPLTRRLFHDHLDQILEPQPVAVTIVLHSPSERSHSSAITARRAMSFSRVNPTPHHNRSSHLPHLYTFVSFLIVMISSFHPTPGHRITHQPPTCPSCSHPPPEETTSISTSTRWKIQGASRAASLSPTSRADTTFLDSVVGPTRPT